MRFVVTRGQWRRIATSCLAVAFAAVLVAGLPTLLILLGIALLGHDYDWQAWQTYMGILALALIQFVVKLLFSDTRDGSLLEAIITFPKRR